MMDAWLRQSRVGPGIVWADAGLKISFDPEFPTKLRQAAAAGEFEELFTRTSYMADQSANMDC